MDVTQRGGCYLITTITWGETTTTTTTIWNGRRGTKIGTKTTRKGSNESTILTRTTKKASLEKGGLAGPI